MKTKEVIKQLQELDPSGEEEVVVWGTDILFIERLPAYYDGFPEILIRDEKGYTTGAKIKYGGDKIKIHTASIEDELFDDPSLPVEVDNRHKDWLINLRKESIKFYENYIKEHPDTPNLYYYKEMINAGNKALEKDMVEEKSLYGKIVDKVKKIWEK